MVNKSTAAIQTTHLMDKSIVENWFVDSGASDIRGMGIPMCLNCHAYHVLANDSAFSFRTVII